MKRRSNDSQDAVAQQQTKVPFDLEELPLELRIAACVPVEIITLLDASSRSSVIGDLLRNDYFWQKKLYYDFPELVEFVGTTLPSWATSAGSSLLGDPEHLDYVPLGPWRRYYYTARYFMRLTYKALIKLGEKWASVCNAIVNKLPSNNFFLKRCSLVSKSTNFVSVYEYQRAPDGVGRLPGVSAIRSIMDIRTFCARYLLRDAHLSALYDQIMSWRDPWHYSLRPAEVNPIRLLMMQVSAYEYLTRNAIFSSAFLSYFRDRGLSKFMGWILHLNPAFNPSDSIMDGGSSSSNSGSGSDEDTVTFVDIGDNVWTRGVNAPLPLPPFTTAEATTVAAKNGAMRMLWTSMEYSRIGPEELRIPVYDEGYLRLRTSYLGIPRDQQGRMLIGKPVLPGSQGSNSSKEKSSLRQQRVFNLEDAALDNDTELHRPVAVSDGLEVMVMAVKDNVPAETHPTMDQLIWVMDGNALLTITQPSSEGRGKKLVLNMEPGDAYLIQRGVEHQIQNITPKEEDRLLRLVTIYSPPSSAAAAASGK